MTNPLVGVWELVSDTHQGLTIFTETHQIHLTMKKERQQFSNENESTEAEEADAYRTLEAGAGTYSVSGSTLTFNWENADRVPHMVGKPYEVEFTVDGDKLTVKGRGGRTLVSRKVG